MTNAYSPAWCRVFLATVPDAQTDAEVAFLARHLPLPRFARVLDVCCGAGRHATRLAALGYSVTGVERDPDLVARARAAAAQGATFVQTDVRALDGVPGAWDAAVILWASFGHFDAEENERLLRAIAARLPRGGRLVLDVYHRGFFDGPPVGREFDRAGERIEERRRVDGDRLHVELRYASGAPPDHFAWQVFTPETLAALAARAGFSPLVSCGEFDERIAASPGRPRMQAVFEKL